MNWVAIVLWILLAILRGMSEKDAVQAAATRFEVSEGDIWRHM